MFVYEYDGDNTDKLICYAGAGFTYDSIGNPTTYRGRAVTWINGRQLASYDGNTYTYDAMGRRTSKKNGNNTTINFTYDSNGNLVSQSNGLEFLYDHTGVFAVILNGATYFYRKNAQGDIIAILDNEGRVVVKYTYDAWGNTVTEVLDCNANAIAELNPFRYRGYYYDIETELYFLKSRYYDPELGRFMTIDDISYLDPSIINGLNLYAYCGNNPVMCADPNGTKFWNKVWDWVNTVAGLANPISTVTAVASVVVAACSGKWGAIKNDFDNGCLNPFNQDEKIALKAEVLGFYKGSTVVRQDVLGTCSAFGTLWLNNTDVDIIDVKHEYGHSIQERMLGPLYWTNVAIPSAAYYFYDKKITGTSQAYYSTPWERVADFFGGVNRGDYKKNSLKWGFVENILGPIVIPFYFMFGY